MLNHFEVKIVEGKYDLKLTRENYAIVNNISSFLSLMRGCDYINERLCFKSMLKMDIY